MSILETLKQYKNEKKISKRNKKIFNLLQIAPLFLAVIFLFQAFYNLIQVNENYSSNLVSISEEYKDVGSINMEERTLKYEDSTDIFISETKKTINLFVFEIFLVMSSMIFVGWLGHHYFDKKTYYKQKIIRKKYSGSIYEFLDKDCPITLEVVSDYKAELEKQLLENREFNVSSLVEIIDTIDDYNTYKKKKQELQDTKDALLNTNTKTGEILREINSIGNQI